jgi:hypothetical protein
VSFHGDCTAQSRASYPSGSRCKSSPPAGFGSRTPGTALKKAVRALQVLADFRGQPRQRLAAYVALSVAGAAFMALGKPCSRDMWLGAGLMAVVAFVVQFSSGINPSFAMASTGAVDISSREELFGAYFASGSAILSVSAADRRIAAPASAITARATAVRNPNSCQPKSPSP